MKVILIPVYVIREYDIFLKKKKIERGQECPQKRPKMLTKEAQIAYQKKKKKRRPKMPLLLSP
jgi:hypothetical protein